MTKPDIEKSMSRITGLSFTGRITAFKPSSLSKLDPTKKYWADKKNDMNGQFSYAGTWNGVYTAMTDAALDSGPLIHLK